MIVTEETTRGATKNTLIWISYLLTVTKLSGPSAHFGRSKKARQKQTFGPETEPVRALLAVERNLREANAIHTLDLMDEVSTKPVDNLNLYIRRRAAEIGLKLPAGVESALVEAWREQQRDLKEQRLSNLRGFTSLRAEFTVAGDLTGDPILTAQASREEHAPTIVVPCRQEHILSLARGLFADGATLRAVCLGSIIRWDNEKRILTVLPVAVYC